MIYQTPPPSFSFDEMAYPSKLLLQAILLAWFMASTVVMARPPPPDSKSTLLARLRLDEDEDEGSSKCWDSLFQLQSCAGEVVLFFLNGETYLGPSCCNAIRTIQHHCWPAMLGSLGFTSQEGDILRGYCDNSVAPPPNTVGPSVNTTHDSLQLIQSLP